MHNVDFLSARDCLARGVIWINELDQAWFETILGSLAANIENNSAVRFLDLVSIEYRHI